MDELTKLSHVCFGAVRIAHDVIKDLGSVGISRVSVPGKDEVVTKADLEISKRWKNYFEEHNFPLVVYTEESRNIPFPQGDEARYLGIGDELDGTFNFNRSKGIIPHCAIFTIFDSLKPKFKDALVTSVLEHNSGNIWYAVKGDGCYFNGKKVFTSRIKELDKDTSIYIDRGPCPSPELSLRFYNLDQKCWPRNISSAGIHFAGVASGGMTGWDAFISLGQKPEELASGYLLLKEAGGHLITTDGKTLDDEFFDFNRMYEIIAASNIELSDKIKNELLSKNQANYLHKKIIS